MWEIIGYTRQLVQKENQQPYNAFEIYVSKPMNTPDSEGRKARRFWYRSTDVNYVPVVGDIVLIDVEVRGKYEIICDIQKVNHAA